MRETNSAGDTVGPRLEASRLWMHLISAWSLVTLALASTGDPVQGETRAENPRPPWELTRREPGEPTWGSLFRLREAESQYRDTAWWNGYAQMRAHVEAGVGNHAAALAAWDSGRGPSEGTVELPAGLVARDAVRYLSAIGDTAQVIMINERHHAASDRLLTLELLSELRRRGFRYLAAEAFAPADSQLNRRSYPTEASGSYVQDPVFAELVREALRLGYTLVAYESTGAQELGDEELTPQQRRDRQQARNLARATVEIDPDAKVLVHAGYSHILEKAGERFRPMALYFREITGIDPVTVDQTRLSERSDPAYEHPVYRACVAAGLLDGGPTIILDAAGRPFAPADFAVDLQVLTPRTRNTEGRPEWMAMGGRRQPITVETRGAMGQWRLVEARLMGEPAQAVPLDRCEVGERKSVRLFLPVGAQVVIQIFDREGRLLRQKVMAEVRG